MRLIIRSGASLPGHPGQALRRACVCQACALMRRGAPARGAVLLVLNGVIQPALKHENLLVTTCEDGRWQWWCLLHVEAVAAYPVLCCCCLQHTVAAVAVASGPCAPVSAKGCWAPPHAQGLCVQRQPDCTPGPARLCIPCTCAGASLRAAP